MAINLNQLFQDMTLLCFLVVFAGRVLYKNYQRVGAGQFSSLANDPVWLCFQSRLAVRKERLYLSLCDVIQLSVCLWQDLPRPKHDFWAAQAILSNFYFWGKNNCSNFFFIPNFLFHLQKFWMFHAILSAQKKCHPKFFSTPIFFWVKQGATQCCQGF